MSCVILSEARFATYMPARVIITDPNSISFSPKQTEQSKAAPKFQPKTPKLNALDKAKDTNFIEKFDSNLTYQEAKLNPRA